jgi:ABC-type branched-subunit amino acid transport system substrate-binding protein
MKKTVILTILAFAFGMVFGSSLMAQSKEPIKIGVIYDFAGGCHMYSEAGVKGIKIALEEINATDFQELEYIIRDTEGGRMGCRGEI